MNYLTIPKNLVEQLCKGYCVLFVGAGISMGKGGLLSGEVRPTRRLVAARGLSAACSSP
jgi:hypothetical protein